MQALADVVGEGYWFGVAKNLDGFAAGIHDDAAVRAAGEVQLEVASHVGVENTVEIA